MRTVTVQSGHSKAILSSGNGREVTTLSRLPSIMDIDQSASSERVEGGNGLPFYQYAHASRASHRRIDEAKLH